MHRCKIGSIIPISFIINTFIVGTLINTVGVSAKHLSQADPAEISFRKVDNAYKIGITSAEIEKELHLQKKEEPVLHDDIYVTIVDTDENGKTVFRKWTPSSEVIAEAENVYFNKKERATMRINENKIAGIIDGRSLSHTEDGYVLRRELPNKLDYLTIDRNTTQNGPLLTASTSRVKAVIETVIVCDKDWGDIFNHNYQDILNYWVVYMWDINMRYKSLPSNDLSFQVNGIVVIKNKGEQPFIEDARASDGRAEYGRILERYRSWAYSQRGNFPPYDMAPLVTNTNLEWGGGLAYLGGACGIDDSNKWSWGTLVFSDAGTWNSITVGAHEMGHNVGAPHDDDPEFPGGCTEHDWIMSGGTETLQYFFSSCSDRAISNFVRSDSAKCLQKLSSTSPKLNPDFNNPKAPSILDQCKRLRKDPEAFLDDKDPGSCKTKICWQKNDSGGWTGYYFTPVDNSECSNGGRCFRGTCRSPGQIFKNVGSGLCILASNPFSSGAPFEMTSCPSPGTPLERLLVKNGKPGSMLQSPYIMGREVGERCAYTGNAEGDVIWTDKCNEDNVWHGWDFQDAGNGQFLLKHRVTGRCAKPESRNKGSMIKTYKACNTKDADMKWNRLN